jgi:hypothetical protein
MGMEQGLMGRGKRLGVQFVEQRSSAGMEREEASSVSSSNSKLSREALSVRACISL